jgi:hypothetical protein
MPAPARSVPGAETHGRGEQEVADLVDVEKQGGLAGWS